MPSSRLISLAVFAFVSLAASAHRRGAHSQAARHRRARLRARRLPERPRARRRQGRRAERAGQHHQAHDRLRRVPRAAREAASRSPTASPSANTPGRPEGSRTFAQVGTQIPVDVLIKGMIVQSGNDATIALAEKLGGTEDGFVQMMNAYARRARAQELALREQLGRPGPDSLHERARHRDAVARADPRLSRRTTSCTRCASSRGTASSSRTATACWRATPSVDGIKTGHTESAGYCLASSAKRNGMRLISVVLGTQSFKAREDASAALLNYGFTFFETVKAKSAGRRRAQARGVQGRGRSRDARARARRLGDRRARLGRAAQDHAPP